MNVKYELSKIFKNKLTIYIFAICLFINGFVIINKPNTIRDYYKYKASYDAMYEKLSGKVTDEDIEYITDKYEKLKTGFLTNTLDKDYSDKYFTGYEIGDYLLYEEIYEKYMYIQNYQEALSDVKNYNEECAIFYDKTGNGNRAIFYNKISETYNDRHIENFYETKNYEYYLSYSFSNLCILFVLLSALHGVFAGERESGMCTLIVTSRYGKSKCFRDKLIASIIATFLINIIFVLEDFVLFTSVFSLKGMMEPVYSIEEMALCIYDVSILGYICIQAAMKFLGMISIMGIMMVASSLANSKLMSIIISILGILPMIIVNKQDVICNAVRLLQINEDACKNNIMIFGSNAYSYLDFTVVTCLIFTLVCILVAYIWENRYNTIFRRERV